MGERCRWGRNIPALSRSGKSEQFCVTAGACLTPYLCFSHFPSGLEPIPTKLLGPYARLRPDALWGHSTDAPVRGGGVHDGGWKEHCLEEGALIFSPFSAIKLQNNVLRRGHVVR